MQPSPSHDFATEWFIPNETRFKLDSSLLRLITKAVSRETISDAVNEFSLAKDSLSSLRQLSLREFMQGSYEVLIGSVIHDEQEKIGEDQILRNNLTLISTFNIKSAPLLVALMRGENIEATLLQYGDNEVSELVPFNTCSNLTKLNIDEFLDDMQRLADLGYVHSDGIIGFEPWFVEINTGKIFLKSWHSLSQIDDPSRYSQSSVRKTFKALLS